MSAFYNDNAPFAATWLQHLTTHGHIAPGRIDQRSIAELAPRDVTGAGQRHFFAGIGGWSHALRLAGIPDTADIWTGSCPCQGLSDAGARRGFLDPRHLWPAWFALIRECRPPIIFGEQVASQLGLEWLDLVFADLERCGYAVGAADLCAAGVGAPHQRQRLFFVAYAPGDRRLQGLLAQLPGRGPDANMPQDGGVADPDDQQRQRHRRARGRRPESPDHDTPSGVADATRERGGRGRQRESPRRSTLEPAGHGVPGVVGDARRHRAREHRGELPRDEAQHGERSSIGGDPPIDPGTASGMADTGGAGSQDGRTRLATLDGGTDSATRGFWADAEWILCRALDGGPPVARPVEPGTFPLAHGIPDRVGLLSGYGNAIVPQVAAQFIIAALDAIDETF